jgi:hypothetical protein
MDWAAARAKSIAQVSKPVPCTLHGAVVAFDGVRACKEAVLSASSNSNV